MGLYESPVIVRSGKLSDQSNSYLPKLLLEAQQSFFPHVVSHAAMHEIEQAHISCLFVSHHVSQTSSFEKIILN